MAFLLSNFDSKPMRVKGQSLFTALAIHNSKQPFEKGLFRGIKSDGLIEVVSAGGHVLPAEEAKAAFALSKPIPISFKFLGDATTSLPEDEIFVSQGSNEIYQRAILADQSLSLNLAGFWLPMSFELNGKECCAGWVRQSNDIVEAILPELAFDLSLIRFKPINAHLNGSA